MKIQFVLLVCIVALVAAAPEKECPKVDDPNPTFIRDDEECGIFYECSAGTAYPFACPPGLYWDVKVNTCNRGVDCGNLKTTTASPTEATTKGTTKAPTEAPTTAAE